VRARRHPGWVGRAVSVGLRCVRSSWIAKGFPEFIVELGNKLVGSNFFRNCCSRFDLAGFTCGESPFARR